MKTINVKEKFRLLSDFWDPKIIGELNGQLVKIAKLKGEFVWHHHDNEDEMFYVVKGELIIKFRDKTAVIKENEFIIVPKGVEHKPIADEEVHLMLFEPLETVNTGELKNELTKTDLEKI